MTRWPHWKRHGGRWHNAMKNWHRLDARLIRSDALPPKRGTKPPGSLVIGAVTSARR